MKIHLEQIKGNDRLDREKKSGFVDSGFVKTWDELVTGYQTHLVPAIQPKYTKKFRRCTKRTARC